MSVRILIGDVRDRLRELADESVHCVVTSPPYWGLRDYGVAGQIGLEETPATFVAIMVDVFREVRRVLCKDGTLWLNLGDSYAGSWGAQSRGNSPSEKSTLTTNNGKGPKAGDKYSILSASQIAAHPKGINTGSIREPGLKPKDLIGIPWRVAFALQADGWYLRQDIIWAKPNPMPESVADRCTKAHEYLFLLSKSARYYYDAEAIAEPRVGNEDAGVAGWTSGPGAHSAVEHNRQKGDAMTFRGGQYVNGRKFDNSHATARDSTGNKAAAKTTRNRRSVWSIATEPFSEAHFATFPPALIEPCILAGCPKGGTVLDPFGGAGTTGLVADRLGRNAMLIELNPEYAEMARRRIHREAPMFADVQMAGAV